MNVLVGCAPCKGGVFQWVRDPPGDVAPAGSNRSSHGGNKVAEAFDVTDHFRRSSECADRNVKQNQIYLQTIIMKVALGSTPACYLILIQIQSVSPTWGGNLPFPAETGPISVAAVYAQNRPIEDLPKK
jgi:hypothetical protein